MKPTERDSSKSRTQQSVVDAQHLQLNLGRATKVIEATLQRAELMEAEPEGRQQWKTCASLVWVD